MQYDIVTNPCVFMSFSSESGQKYIGFWLFTCMLELGQVITQTTVSRQPKSDLNFTQ